MELFCIDLFLDILFNMEVKIEIRYCDGNNFEIVELLWGYKMYYYIGLYNKMVLMVFELLLKDMGYNYMNFGLKYNVKGEVIILVKDVYLIYLGD